MFYMQAVLCQFQLQLILPFEDRNLFIGHLLFLHLLARFGREYGLENDSISAILWSKYLYQHFRSFFEVIRNQGICLFYIISAFIFDLIIFIQGNIEYWMTHCFGLINKVLQSTDQFLLQVKVLER